MQQVNGARCWSRGRGVVLGGDAAGEWGEVLV